LTIDDSGASNQTAPMSCLCLLSRQQQ
jgi:hypothetical protein